MNFEEVLTWCRQHDANVRGITRGKTIAISHRDPQISGTDIGIGEIFHWDMSVDGLRHPVSASDMERLVNGRMSLEEWKSTLRGGG